ncbi:hypothetical protein KSP40_PGU015125 [Platanthera guangdongensis]|uniref:sucrose synthase n=1 Tax=Platanthera guangdongensis TaxID=2320717 RepID=A0ABR2MR11_9ASPA
MNDHGRRSSTFPPQWAPRPQEAISTMWTANNMFKTSKHEKCVECARICRHPLATMGQAGESRRRRSGLWRCERAKSSDSGRERLRENLEDKHGHWETMEDEIGRGRPWKDDDFELHSSPAIGGLERIPWFIHHFPEVEQMLNDLLIQFINVDLQNIKDVANELARELQATSDLIVGNYSDGNLVASLLAHKLGVTQILGSGMSNKMWDVLIEHVKTCRSRSSSGKVVVGWLKSRPPCDGTSSLGRRRRSGELEDE